MQSILLARACLATAATCAQAQKGKSTMPPNILFVLADDFGYYDMSGTGSKFLERPTSTKLPMRECFSPIVMRLVSQLHKELFDYLNAVGARFPVKDLEYSAVAEQKYLDGIVKNRLPQLEKQRLNFLSKDFDPNNNWWGSTVTKD